MTNPESVYVVSLFLKIQCTLKQIMKFIFQILFLQNKSPQFYFSPSPPCFTILNFLSSFFSCLGLKSPQRAATVLGVCVQQSGDLTRERYTECSKVTPPNCRKPHSTFPPLEHHECHSTM